MITPKFREIMTRIEGRGFVVRLWWNGSKTKPACDTRAMELEQRFLEVLCEDCDVEDAEEELLEFIDYSDGLAAYEILNDATHNGIVGYIEWP